MTAYSKRSVTKYSNLTEANNIMENLINVDLSQIDGTYVITNPTLRNMHAEADAVQTFLEREVDINDIAMLPYRLNQMDAYLHRLSDMQSRAKAMKEYAKMTYMAQNEKALSKMTATNSNRIISAALYEFTVTADRMDALYTSLTHACKNISIQLSWIKKTMELGG